MAGNRKSILDSIDVISRKAGEIFCYVIFLIMIITTIGVVARYVFNRPLLWGWLLNRQLFGIFALFAGIYTLSKGGHIKIGIFSNSLPPRARKVAGFISLLSFVAFMAVLVWQSAWMGWNSFMMHEVAAGAFRIPLYPFKLFIPLMAFLFLLEGIVVFLRDDKKGSNDPF